MPRGISTEKLSMIKCGLCNESLSPSTKWQKYHKKCGKLARWRNYLAKHGFKK